jgi:hypothetical protein
MGLSEMQQSMIPYETMAILTESLNKERYEAKRLRGQIASSSGVKENCSGNNMLSLLETLE